MPDMQPSTNMNQQKTGTAWTRNAAWVIFFIAVIFSIVLRTRLLDFPLERDEGEYAYMGQLILQGIPPYELACNMKFPGTYLAYAGIMTVFGQTTVGIHLGLTIVNLATICLLFFFIRELFDSLTAAIAALVLAILSSSYSVLGVQAHATHFMALFGVWGTWILWRALNYDKLKLYFFAGLLLGLALLTKQQGLFLPFFGGLAALFSFYRRRSFFSSRHMALCVVYAGGVILPFATTCLWLWLAGVFDKFWFWTISYAHEYVTQTTAKEAAALFQMSICSVIKPNVLIWILALIGVIALALTKGKPGRRVFCFAYFISSFLCICPGFYFREHYYIIFLPCIAISAAIGFMVLARLTLRLLDLIPSVQKASPNGKHPTTTNKYGVGRSGTIGNFRRYFQTGLAALIPTLLIAYPVWTQRDYYFFMSSEMVCRCVYAGNPFIECIVIADYLNKHLGPEDHLAVIGSEPEVYFYTRRTSSTSYIHMYPLMEIHPFARKMQEEMIAQIQSTKPEYLLFVNVRFSWLPRPGTDMFIVDWLSFYLPENYMRVGLADMISPTYTEYKWDEQAQNAMPQSSFHIWVLKRK